MLFNLSLRTKFIIVLLPIVIIPTFILAWLAYEYVAQNVRNDKQDRVETFLAQAIHSANFRLNMAEANINHLSHAQILYDSLIASEDQRSRTLQPVLMTELALLRKNYPQYKEVRIVDREGNIIACLAKFTNCLALRSETFARLPTLLPAQISSKSTTLYINDLESNSKLVLEVKPLILKDKVNYSQDIKREFRGYLLLTMELDYVFEMMLSNQPNDNSLLTLVEKQGGIISQGGLPHTMDHLEFITLLGDDFFQHKRQTEYQSHLLDNKNYLLKVMPATGFMDVLVAIPEQELLVLVRKHGVPVILILTAILAITFVMIFWQISLQVLQPIKLLQSAVQDIEEDNSISIKPSVKQDEIGKLSRSFYRMTQHVLDKQSEIHK